MRVLVPSCEVDLEILSFLGAVFTIEKSRDGFFCDFELIHIPYRPID